MKILEIADNLFAGLTPEHMQHLPEISSYNHNYYVISGRLLYAESDDDNFTQWYWVRGSRVNAFGGSYCTDDDRIVVDQAYT